MVQYTSHEKNLTQSDFDEALHIATESEYGKNIFVWSEIQKYSHKVKEIN